MPSSIFLKAAGSAILVLTNVVNGENIHGADSSLRGSSSGSGDVTLSSHHNHGHHHRKDGSSSSKSYDFDFYVYAMTFQPEFCREHASDSFAGCLKPDEDWEGQLTIHGLWPQYGDGSWPSSCTNEPFDAPTILRENPDLATQMEKKWPNVKALPPPPTDVSDSSSSLSHDSFWNHEWSKHGTCTGLTQLEYFKSALQLLLPTPELVRTRYGHKLSKKNLLEGYGGASSTAAICNYRNDDEDGVGYLSEVRVCFGKDATGGSNKPGERMDCPSVVLEEDTCGEFIKIASFDVVAAQNRGGDGNINFNDLDNARNKRAWQAVE